MLTSVILALGDVPRYIAPAMNTNMYENRIVQDNLIKLQKYGFKIIEPKEARLACGDLGKGALADVETIIRTVKECLGD
jgi:phosphopantothenoylcysteine decarboxylase/phosphopantothenoylcysteine decarboxylase/phosphopantothenate--cysteine ligase